MSKAGMAVELLETRHVRTAFKAMPVKTDKKDARGIAQLMRLGWIRPVWCKSVATQEVRAMLPARKLLQGKLHDVEMALACKLAVVMHRMLHDQTDFIANRKIAPTMGAI